MSTGTYVGAIVGGLVGLAASYIPGVNVAWYTAMYFGMMVGAGVGTYMDPVSQPSYGKPEVQAFEIPTAAEQLPVPDLLGVTKVSGNIVDYWGNSVKRIKEGGAVMGYSYKLSWVLVLCSGPVDQLFAIWNGEKVFSTVGKTRGGSSYETCQVNDFGTFRIYWGTENQVVDPAVEANCVANNKVAPTYRGYCYIVFVNCKLGGYNRVPALHFVIRKSPVLSFSSSNMITKCDYNPAHAIYYILIGLRGFPSSSINMQSFAEAALKFYNEGFGICIFFKDFQEALDYLSDILKHVDASLVYDTDGTFKLNVFRSNTIISNMLLIDENILIEKPIIDRQSMSDTINQFKVMYPKRSSTPSFLGLYTIEREGFDFYPYDFIETSDGCILVVGTYFEYIDSIAAAVKFNENGIVWMREYLLQDYGGEDHTYGSLKSVIEVVDGYVVLGKEINPSEDSWCVSDIMLKINFDGEIVWSKMHVTIWADEMPGRINPTSDGGIIYISSTYDGGYAVPPYELNMGDYTPIIYRFDSNGNLLWSHVLKAGIRAYFNAIEETSDGGFIGVTGRMNPSRYGDLRLYNPLIFKLDSSGHLVWARDLIRNAVEYSDVPNVIHQTSDGGYITVITAYCMVIIKLNSIGDTEWQKIFENDDATGWYADQQQSDIGECSDGYVVSSYKMPYGIAPIRIIKLGFDGSIMWVKKVDQINGDDGWAPIVRSLTGEDIGMVYSVNSTSNDQCIAFAKLTKLGEIPNCAYIMSDTDTNANADYRNENAMSLLVQNTLVFKNNYSVGATSLTFRDSAGGFCTGMLYALAGIALGHAPNWHAYRVTQNAYASGNEITVNINPPLDEAHSAGEEVYCYTAISMKDWSFSFIDPGMISNLVDGIMTTICGM